MFGSLYKNFSPLELRNLFFYIAGIMCYKFALETMVSCVSSIIIKRLPLHVSDTTWTLLQAINNGMQCIGSLMVAPLIKRFSTNSVLAISIWSFGIIISIVPILEAVTGGTIDNNGSWDPRILFLIYPLAGLFHGVIELIRRVIPRDIVGSDSIKLKKMDSTVHIWYEVAGTSGALLARFWVRKFKFAFALTILPIFFTVAGFIWWNIRVDDNDVDPTSSEKKATDYKIKEKSKTTISRDILNLMKAFAHSVYVGAKLVLTNRTLIWLIPAYTLPLVLHRYVENVIFTQYANNILKDGTYQQTFLGGSNFGELLGALFVLLFANTIKTPLPWIRLDSFAILLLWIIPLSTPFQNTETWVWTLFPLMMVVSFGWASGDVSLVAYIQSRLSKIESTDKETSPLGAVMAFLYVGYIVIFACLAPVMGKVMDYYKKLNNPQGAFFYTTGVFLSVAAVIIFASTFIPKGSFAFNPEDCDEDSEIKQLDQEKQGYGNNDVKRSENANIIELVTS